MNLKSFFPYILFFIVACTASDFFNKTSYDLLMQEMLHPIECNRQGIKDFFKLKFNHPCYKDFFSTCFMHVIDLVEYAHNSCNSPVFLEHIFWIFSQKLKEMQWVNPYALIYFFEHAQPILIDIYLSERYSLKQFVEEYLSNALADDFELLQRDPSKFVKTHASQLIDQITSKSNAHENTRRSFALFVEQSVDRLVFDPTEGYSSWECLLHLLSSIKNMHHASLLYDEATYHRIIWGACMRFAYCIELQRKDLNNEDCQKIIAALESETIDIFMGDEWEPLLMTKRDWLVMKISSCMKKNEPSGVQRAQVNYAS